MADVCGGTTPSLSSHTHSTATSQTISQNWTRSAGAGICTFDCDTNYTWSGGTSSCMANSQSMSCIGLPSNGVWNTVSSIIQTWNGSSWIPSTTGIYNTSASTTNCNYTCNAGFHTENAGVSCVSSTQNCAITNGVGSQTWNTGTSAWNSCTVVSCNTGFTVSGNSCITSTYTVSGGFGANANGATISVCGSNVTANASGNFSTTRNYGSVCNNITASRTGYTCSTSTNGPASLVGNFTTVAGNCVSAFPLALSTGGTITTSGNYRIHTFLTSGTFTPSGAGTVEYLVVAGGGGCQ